MKTGKEYLQEKFPFPKLEEHDSLINKRTGEYVLNGVCFAMLLEQYAKEYHNSLQMTDEQMIEKLIPLEITIDDLRLQKIKLEGAKWYRDKLAEKNKTT